MQTQQPSKESRTLLRKYKESVYTCKDLAHIKAKLMDFVNPWP